jgi:hypothetical protein
MDIQNIIVKKSLGEFVLNNFEYSKTNDKLSCQVQLEQQSTKAEYDERNNIIKFYNPLFANKIKVDGLRIEDNSLINILQNERNKIEKEREEYINNVLASKIPLVFKLHEGEYLGLYWVLHSDIENLEEIISKKLGVEIFSTGYSYVELGSTLHKYLFEKEENNKVEIFFKDLIEILKEDINKAKQIKLERLKKEQERIQFLLNNNIELAKIIFTDKVHIDERGYFSKCEDYCDDCFWYDYIQKPYYEKVRGIAPTFVVKSKYKQYIYYQSTEKVLLKLIELYSDIFNKEKENYIKRLKEIENELLIK